MRISEITVVFCVALSLSGCALRKYRPAPISPAQSAESFQTRNLSDPGLREFLSSRSQHPPATWPLAEWNLADLTHAAFYYNPTLQIARARLSEAEAAIVTAGARPNPGLSSDLGGESAPESPWIAGLGFSLPLETAGKRRHRITQAESLTDAVRWNLANAAWAVRSQLRSAVLESLAAVRNLALLQSEERAQAELVHLLEQRLEVGLIPRPEVDNARIQHMQTLLAVRAAEGRISQAQAALAAAIGVPVAALDGIHIIWPTLNQAPSMASLSLSDIHRDAVLNRLDIRRALAEYAASEAALQLEIAKQYPDVELGPGYAFEEGSHLYSLGVRLTLPIFNRNQGPIAEAYARREGMAAQFIAVQASGVAESEQALARYASALNELAEARQLLQQSLTQEQAAQKALQGGESDRVALNGTQLQTAVASVAEQEASYRVQKALGELENAVQRPLEPGDIQPLSPQSPVLKPVTRR
jgi:cobalt-zinc-cadmium efflux system outer membrane protein